MEITEVTLGTDHQEYSIRLNNLAMLLEAQVRVSVSGSILVGYNVSVINT